MTFIANGKTETCRFFGCVYHRMRLFAFAMNIRRRYSIFLCFIYGVEEKNSRSEVLFAVCRLLLT